MTAHHLLSLVAPIYPSPVCVMAAHHLLSAFKPPPPPPPPPFCVMTFHITIHCYVQLSLLAICCCHCLLPSTPPLPLTPLFVSWLLTVCCQYLTPSHPPPPHLFVSQREMKQLEERNAELEDMVQRLQFENKAKEQILNDTREILRWASLWSLWCPSRICLEANPHPSNIDKSSYTHTLACTHSHTHAHSLYEFPF